ncbi:uncharacterized protein BJX67DRAFT_160833 [Aspergillus lucknowensis]|uniref:Cytochrome c oxidase assembly protein n=1 Tax=Aspergillus lucknowensis TaxID=176173 RepID=A0ABR4M479_9EURO
MQPELSASPPQRPSWKRHSSIRPVRFGRWSIPLLATLAVGYGITNYQSAKQERPYQLAEEAERLRKNQEELMDSYGYKDSVDDLQRALEAYEGR